MSDEKTEQHQDIDWTVFNEPEGWKILPSARWLLRHGRRLDRMDLIAEGLIAKLQGSEAPVDRLRLIAMTLHPLVRAWGAEWDRGKGVRQIEIPFGIMETPSYIGSPAATIRQTGKPCGRGWRDR